MQLQKHRGAVRAFAWLMKFSAWLAALPNKVTPPPFRLMQIGSAFWQSRVLYVAARLDIASVLGDTPLAADALAARLAVQEDALYRLLRMLVAMGIFLEVSPRVFANNRMSSYLRADNPQNVRAMILMHNSEVMSRPWYEQLEAGVRSGAVPFELAHGQPLFSYMDDHPEFDALFASAMDSVEALAGDSYATDFDWGRFARVIDVGGSKGSKSLSILKRHAGLTALVVDRQQVIRDAEHYWTGRADPALLARLGFAAGDVLESVPAANSDRDIYLLGAVLHGFDDATCARALHNIAVAAGDTGARIALLEMIMPEQQADLVSASFDMQMFMGTTGRERTLREWRGLFEQAGLHLEQVVNLRTFGKILVLQTNT